MSSLQFKKLTTSIRSYKSKYKLCLIDDFKIRVNNEEEAIELLQKIKTYIKLNNIPCKQLNKEQKEKAKENFKRYKLNNEDRLRELRLKSVKKYYRNENNRRRLNENTKKNMRKLRIKRTLEIFLKNHIENINNNNN